MVAERNGWLIVHEFVDKGSNGAKGREQRPAFDALWKGAIHREFDVVRVWAVDRLGRSLSHLVNFLSEVHAKKVDLFIHQQGIDTTTPVAIGGGEQAVVNDQAVCPSSTVRRSHKVVVEDNRFTAPIAGISF